jgi:hypothetical protein
MNQLLYKTFSSTSVGTPFNDLHDQIRIMKMEHSKSEFGVICNLEHFKINRLSNLLGFTSFTSMNPELQPKVAEEMETENSLIIDDLRQKLDESLGAAERLEAANKVLKNRNQELTKQKHEAKEKSESMSEDIKNLQSDISNNTDVMNIEKMRAVDLKNMVIQEIKLIFQKEKDMITVSIEDCKQHMKSKFDKQNDVLDNLKKSNQNLLVAIKKQEAIIKFNDARLLVIKSAANILQDE